MSNPQQNKIHSEIEQFKREINLLQDKLKQSKRKKKVYCKMDKSESQKWKMDPSELQKCIRKYRMKQINLKGT